MRVTPIGLRDATDSLSNVVPLAGDVANADHRDACRLVPLRLMVVYISS